MAVDAQTSKCFTMVSSPLAAVYIVVVTLGVAHLSISPQGPSLIVAVAGGATTLRVVVTLGQKPLPRVANSNRAPLVYRDRRHCTNKVVVITAEIRRDDTAVLIAVQGKQA